MSIKEGPWSRQQTLKLISEFKKHEHLYNINHKDYVNVYKKKDAIEEITEALKVLKKNVCASDVRKKIKVLRQQAAAEKKKIRAARRSGMPADEDFVSKLWCYKELKFLMDVGDDSKRKSNLEINKVSKIFSLFYLTIHNKIKRIL